MVSDNGPQFSSAEFTAFAKTWNLDHKTSSPHHHQSNGKAENAVRTVKRLFRKCTDSGQSEFLAIIIIIIIIIIIKIYRAPKTINTLRRYLQQLECIVIICKII